MVQKEFCNFPYSRDRQRPRPDRPLKRESPPFEVALAMSAILRTWSAGGAASAFSPQKRIVYRSRVPKVSSLPVMA
jgi:hypothetical protein